MKQIDSSTPPCVLIFSGSDPCSGAGLQADILAISALACHPLVVLTTLTVQDNVRVFAVRALDSAWVRQQAQVLIDRFPIHAVKLGVSGSRANAATIASLIQQLRIQQPDLPVVLDPVLANHTGDRLSTDHDAALTIEPLYALTTIITPNFHEAQRLGGSLVPEQQAARLLKYGCQHVLLKGGDDLSQQDIVINRWYSWNNKQVSDQQAVEQAHWHWPRLPASFHGSGCTLAAALSACLAKGLAMRDALEQAQYYTQHTLATSYAIAAGARIPNRVPAIDIQALIHNAS